MSETDPTDNEPKELVQYIDLNLPKRLTKRNLEKTLDKAIVDALPVCLPDFWNALSAGMKEGDPKALRLFAEVAGYTKKNGPVVNVQQNNNTINAGAGFSFEKVIRSLDDKHHKQSKTGVIDAEIVE